MVAQNLSLTVEDPDGTLLGCLIVTDLHGTLADAPPAGPFPEIAALTHRLTQSYARSRDVQPGQIALVDMAAVHPDARGSGVYMFMRKAIQARLKAAGWRFVVGELSSLATQNVVLEKLGHRNVAEINFSEFKWNGTHPFRAITSPPNLILAEGTL
ncbi:MAG: hypothetical protein AAGL23_07520 [Pseudomonadota bacterium]